MLFRVPKRKELHHALQALPTGGGSRGKCGQERAFVSGFLGKEWVRESSLGLDHVDNVCRLWTSRVVQHLAWGN